MQHAACAIVAAVLAGLHMKMRLKQLYQFNNDACIALATQQAATAMRTLNDVHDLA